MLRPFPWADLPRLTLRDQKAGRLRASLEPVPDPARVGAALSELLRVPCHVAPGPTVRGPASEALLRLALDGLAAPVNVALDGTLAVELVGRLLGRPTGMARPGAPADEALAGALAALAGETGRRAGVQRLPSMRAVREPPGTIVEHLLVHLTVGGRPHTLAIEVGAAELAAPTTTELLTALGDQSLTVPLVVGSCGLSREDVGTLAVYDAIACDDGWTIDALGVGEGVLAAPEAEWGWPVRLDGTGATVLGSRPKPLPWNAVMEDSPDLTPPAPDDTAEASPALLDVALDAPVVLRVEVGAVTLPARDWATLTPGDVVATERPVTGEAILRAAGQVVGRGELVDLEGALAVRIVELNRGGSR